LPLVYDELRKVAAVRLVRSAPQATLQPTALVHEAYLRLVGSGDPGWNGKRHFFGAAARAMRNILVDRAKQKAAVKRGGGLRRVGMDAIDTSPGLAIEEIDFVGLDSALTEFERVSSEATQVVMLRYFAGLSETETAKMMGLSVTTVRRRWAYAKAWLHRRLAADALA
jgi:RNA polymerase sigma factor (TIGR02999 family)